MEKHIFISLGDKTQLTLPVTPGKYTLGFGMSKKIVDIYGAGEYTLPGRRTASSTNLDVLLPAQRYPFCAPEWQTPEDILKWLRRQVENRYRIQYIIAGVEDSKNEYYYIQTVSYGEQDGTGDIYARIVLQQAPMLEAPTSQVPDVRPSVVVPEPIPDPEKGWICPSCGHEYETTTERTFCEKCGWSKRPPTPAETEYVVKSAAENLWTICWDTYGRDDVVTLVASHNGIDPYDPLKVGQVLYLEDLGDYKRGGWS